MISLFPNNRKNYSRCYKTKQVIIPTIDSLHREKERGWINKVGLLSQQNNDTIKKILQQTDKIEKNKASPNY
jgi:hypothetical protein